MHLRMRRDALVHPSGWEPPRETPERPEVVRVAKEERLASEDQAFLVSSFAQHAERTRYNPAPNDDGLLRTAGTLCFDLEACEPRDPHPLLSMRAENRVAGEHKAHRR